MLGMLWGVCTGDYALALPLAIFFELFWLDVIPIGSYIPPMPAFSYLILLSLASTFGWTSPESITFPLAMTLPLAHLIPLLENSQRSYQRAAYSRLVGEARKNRVLGSLPGKLLLISALQQIIAGWLCFFTIAIFLTYLFSRKFMQDVLIPLSIGWTELYTIALIGALLSLRIRRAYVTFAASMLIVMSIRFLLFT